jgi:hypothetical protein
MTMTATSKKLFESTIRGRHDDAANLVHQARAGFHSARISAMTYLALWWQVEARLINY